MKFLMTILLLFFTGLTEAEDDFWSTDSSKEAQEETKGKVPALEAGYIQESKSLTLPGPGADTYCMATIVSPQKMIEAMKSMFPGGKLPDPTEWQNFAKQSEKAHQQAAPSLEHCLMGDWISVADNFTAAALCDFDSTPASAATFGVCRYRGQARNVRKE